VDSSLAVFIFFLPSLDVHFAVLTPGEVRCSHVSAITRHLWTGLWRVKTCFIARHMLLSDGDGSIRYPLAFARLSPYPTIPGFFSTIPSASALAGAQPSARLSI